MDQFSDFVADNRPLIGALALAVVVLLLIYYNRNRLKYVLMEIRYSLPLIGRGARLVRRGNHRPGQDGWFPAEIAVCADYHRFYVHYRSDRGFYESCRTYLKKVGEIGRRPMPWYLWVGMALMIFLEAYGFSYVLTLWGWVQASERQVPYLAAALATLLAIVAMWLTHQCGQQLYRNARLHRVRREFVDDPRRGLTPLAPSGATIGVDDDQSVDDNVLPPIQTLNRLNHRTHETGYGIIVLAIAYIAIIAAGSTYIRLQAFRDNEILQQRQSALYQDNAGSDTVTVGQIPQSAVDQNQAASAKAAVDQANVESAGAWTTFAVMATIFVGIQIVSIMLGQQYGFIGAESDRAWKASHAFNTGDEYQAYHVHRQSEIANQAQTRLSDVQGRMQNAVKRDPSDGRQIEAAMHPENRTFMAYVAAMAGHTARVRGTGEYPLALPGVAE